jgi:hypothetical protein
MDRGEDLTGMQLLAVNTPYWVTLILIVVLGLIWAHSERDSGLRKLSAAAFGIAAALGAVQLLNHFAGLL